MAGEAVGVELDFDAAAVDQGAESDGGGRLARKEVAKEVVGSGKDGGAGEDGGTGLSDGAIFQEAEDVGGGAEARWEGADVLEELFSFIEVDAVVEGTDVGLDTGDLGQEVNLNERVVDALAGAADDNVFEAGGDLVFLADEAERLRGGLAGDDADGGGWS